MNTDFRVCCSFANHYKTVKLIRRLGLKGPACLVFLWAHVASSRPGGDITGMSEEDISIASKWDEEPKKFIDALIDIGFLDEGEGRLVIHEWDMHNGYASGAVIRKERSKKAAVARWKGKDAGSADAQAMLKQCGSNVQAMLKQCSSNAESETGNAGAMLEQCPSPLLSSPLLSSPLLTLTESGSDKQKPEVDQIPYAEIIAEYHRLLPDLPKVKEVGKTIKSQIRARWDSKADRRNLQWWTDYWTLVAQCPHLLGKSGEWVSSAGWLTLPTNMEKVLNGAYVKAQPKLTGNVEMQDTTNMTPEQLKAYSLARLVY